MLVLLNTVCTLFFEKIVVNRFIQPVTYVKTELKRIARMEAEMSISKGEMMIGGGRFESGVKRVTVVRHMTTAMREKKKELEETNEVQEEINRWHEQQKVNVSVEGGGGWSAPEKEKRYVKRK